MKANVSENQYVKDNALLTSAEVMAILRIGRSKLWQITKDEELKGVKIGRSWRYTKENLEHYMKGEPQE